MGTGHSLGSAQFATGQEINFPDTTALDPACFPSGDIRDFCATTSRASAAGFAGDSWGRDSSGGMAEPSSKQLSRPGPRRPFSVGATPGVVASEPEAGDARGAGRAVREARAAARGCPLPQGPIPRAPPPPTSSLPIAKSPCKVGTKHSLPSALRKWSPESPGYRELCCPILRSLVGDLRAGKPDTHLTMETVPEASVLPVPEMLKAWPSCSPRPRTPSGSPPPLLLLLELHSSRRRHAGPRGSC